MGCVWTNKTTIDNNYYTKTSKSNLIGEFTATAVVGKSGAVDYVCDGTADDVQIQAAIDYVSGLGGGYVATREGTYACAASIVIPANVCLVGMGMSATVLEYSGTDYAVKIAQTVGAHHSSISNLKIVGNVNALGAISAGATSTYISEVAIRDVYIYNFKKSGAIGINLDSLSYVVLNRIKIRQCDNAYGIVVTASVNTGIFSFSELNLGYDDLKYGIYLDGTSGQIDGITIDACGINASDTAIIIEGSVFSVVFNSLHVEPKTATAMNALVHIKSSTDGCSVVLNNPIFSGRALTDYAIYVEGTGSRKITLVNPVFQNLLVSGWLVDAQSTSNQVEFQCISSIFVTTVVPIATGTDAWRVYSNVKTNAIVAKNADYTLTEEDNGKTFVGHTNNVVFTLPTLKNGFEFTFIVGTSAVTVDVLSAVKILPTVTVTGKKLQNAGTLGESVTIRANATFDWWDIVGYCGTWTAES